MPKETEELEVKWNADIIDFWTATLENYRTCHEAVEPIDNPQTVTDALVEMLVSQAAEISEHAEKDKPHTDLEENANVQADQEEEELEIEEVREEEVEAEGEDGYDEEDNEYEEEEETRTKKKRRTDNNAYQEYYYGEYSQYPPQAEQYTHTAPPVPPMMSGNDEGLSNLIMAWYYAGYYTGLYQAQRR